MLSLFASICFCCGTIYEMRGHFATFCLSVHRLDGFSLFVLVYLLMLLYIGGAFHHAYRHTIQFFLITKGRIAMKNIVPRIVLTLFLAVPLLHGQEKATQVAWRDYGNGVKMKEMTPLKSLLDRGKDALGKEVVVEGVVTEVCQTRGCWMVVEDGESHVRVEFEKYGFFVPWDSKGKKVKLQGRLTEKTVGAAAAKHMADEMSKPPVEKKQIQEKQTIVIFLASGVSMESGSEISQKQMEVIGESKEHHHE